MKTRPSDRQEVHQCKTCPWRVGCVPERDIPRYEVDLHQGLTRTIARSAEESLAHVLSGACQRTMACHYSEPGKMFACAGWLHHQIGPGNNIAVRLGVITGSYPVPVVTGAQHQTFEATLCGRTR